MAPARQKTLGDIIREARIDTAGLGLRELARKLDKAPSYVSDIENDRRVPSEDVLKQLAKYLALDFEHLMSLAGRLGATTERLVERNPEAVALFRRISKLRPAQLRHLAEQLDEITEDKEPSR